MTAMNLIICSGRASQPVGQDCQRLGCFRSASIAKGWCIAALRFELSCICIRNSWAAGAQVHVQNIRCSALASWDVIINGEHSITMLRKTRTWEDCTTGGKQETENRRRITQIYGKQEDVQRGWLVSINRKTRRRSEGLARSINRAA